MYKLSAIFGNERLRKLVSKLETCRRYTLKFIFFLVCSTKTVTSRQIYRLYTLGERKEKGSLNNQRNHNLSAIKQHVRRYQKGIEVVPIASPFPSPPSLAAGKRIHCLIELAHLPSPLRSLICPLLHWPCLVASLSLLTFRFKFTDELYPVSGEVDLWYS
jgi:hypothetical protein